MLTDCDEEYFPPENKQKTKQKEADERTNSGARMMGEAFSSTYFCDSATQLPRMMSLVYTQLLR